MAASQQHVRASVGGGDQVPVVKGLRTPSLRSLSFAHGHSVPLRHASGGGGGGGAASAGARGGVTSMRRSPRQRFVSTISASGWSGEALEAAAKRLMQVRSTSTEPPGA